MNNLFVEGLEDDDNEFEDEEGDDDETEEIENVDCSNWGFGLEKVQTSCWGSLQNRQQFPVAFSLVSWV